MPVFSWKPIGQPFFKNSYIKKNLTPNPNWPVKRSTSKPGMGWLNTQLKATENSATQLRVKWQKSVILDRRGLSNCREDWRSDDKTEGTSARWSEEGIKGALWAKLAGVEGKVGDNPCHWMGSADLTRSESVESILARLYCQRASEMSPNSGLSNDDLE